MRALWLGLLLALAPIAAAQASVDLASVKIEPFEKAVEPLKGTVSTRVLAHVSCALTDGANGVPLTYRVTRLPAWATAIVSPASDVIQVVSCNGSWGDANATLTVTANDQAPAFMPDIITLELTAGSAGRAQTTTANVTLSAAYYSVLDVRTPEAIATAEPGGSHTFHITATNFGNGATRVEWHLGQPGQGIRVALPWPVSLESRQMGGANTSITVPIQVTADNESFVDRVTEFDVKVTSAYALDDKVAGDSSTVSFLLTVRSGGAAGEKTVPVGIDIIIAALCSGAVLLRERRAARARSLPRRE